MNNNSPNSLKDNIKVLNSNLDEVDIIEVNGNSYILDSIMESFMKENDINDKDILLDSVKSFYNIESLSILERNSNDEDLNFAYEAMLLLENLNPREVMKAANGKSLIKQFIDQFYTFAKGEKYNEEAEIKKRIKKCDSVLADIKEERSLAKDKSKKSSSIKFSAMYFFNIAKKLVSTFVIPSILSSEKIKLPAAIAKLFAIKNSVIKSDKARKAISYTLTGLDLATSLPPDIEGLYLSFADYDKLLAKYENQIKSVKYSLNNELRGIEMSKGINTRMIKLTEDSVSTDAVEVHYQTPEELVMKDRIPEVVHDDDNQHADIQLHADNNDDAYASPIYSEPHNNLYNKHTDLTPIDIIRKVRCNPNTVSIAKYGDKYYIDHKDLQCYMDACGENKYENALNSIIASHKDPNLCAESVRVIMGRDDVSNLDSKTKLAIESSDVRFEVY